MKYMLAICLLLCSVLLWSDASAISIVYNFRIGQVTKQPISQKSHKQHSVGALLFDVYQKKYSGRYNNFAGGFASYIHAFDPYYARVDFAASHIEAVAELPEFAFSGAATDDILFTFGRNFTLMDKARLTLSGFFGVPTHPVNSLQHVDFGTGQFGAGIQLDGSYEFNERSAVLYGVRYIRFFARHAQDFLGRNYTFTIGNVNDALVAYKYNRTKQGFEAGYTIRSLYGADITPRVVDIINQTNYLLSSFYFIYKRRVVVKSLESRLLANISYGFDHRPQIFSNKFIISIWGAWGINF